MGVRRQARHRVSLRGSGQLTDGQAITAVRQVQRREATRIRERTTQQQRGMPNLHLPPAMASPSASSAMPAASFSSSSESYYSVDVGPTTYEAWKAQLMADRRFVATIPSFVFRTFSGLTERRLIVHDSCCLPQTHTLRPSTCHDA